MKEEDNNFELKSEVKEIDILKQVDLIQIYPKIIDYPNEKLEIKKKGKKY